MPNLNQELKNSAAKTNRVDNGRSKAEEDKARESAASGLSASQQNTLNGATERVREKNEIGNGANGVSGTSRATQAKTVDQSVRQNQQSGVAETAFKAQNVRAQRTLDAARRDVVSAQAKFEDAQELKREQTQQIASQRQRSDATAFQQIREKQAVQQTAQRQQSVEVQQAKSGERPQASVLNDKVQAQRVQQTQESNQAAKYKAIADAQFKADVKRNDDLLREAVKGPSEAQKTKQNGETPGRIGQNINIRA
ncbi:hypothetical protein V8J88_19035 [Massilia sp. W12]|uniref:hypothetical protein n=1 Tax=Massilia sp. W12 TaxID=3126507 RepID=UPI0030D005CD